MMGQQCPIYKKGRAPSQKPAKSSLGIAQLREYLLHSAQVIAQDYMYNSSCGLPTQADPTRLNANLGWTAALCTLGRWV